MGGKEAPVIMVLAFLLVMFSGVAALGHDLPTKVAVYGPQGVGPYQEFPCQPENGDSAICDFTGAPARQSKNPSYFGVIWPERWGSVLGADGPRAGAFEVVNGNSHGFTDNCPKTCQTVLLKTDFGDRAGAPLQFNSPAGNPFDIERVDDNRVRVKHAGGVTPGPGQPVTPAPTGNIIGSATAWQGETRLCEVQFYSDGRLGLINCGPIGVWQAASAMGEETAVSNLGNWFFRPTQPYLRLDGVYWPPDQIRACLAAVPGMNWYLFVGNCPGFGGGATITLPAPRPTPQPGSDSVSPFTWLRGVEWCVNGRARKTLAVRNATGAAVALVGASPIGSGWVPGTLEARRGIVQTVRPGQTVRLQFQGRCTSNELQVQLFTGTTGLTPGVPVARAETARLEIYDLSGQLVGELIQTEPLGLALAQFQRRLANGVYFYVFNGQVRKLAAKK